LVEVNRNNETNHLSEMHSIRLLNGMVYIGEHSNEVEATWLNNEGSFSSIPYFYVIKEFERQYNVKIIIENGNTERLFTGRFSHNNMILALKSITVPQNISYQINEDRRVILSSAIE
jgi:hypothetical protein